MVKRLPGWLTLLYYALSCSTSRSTSSSTQRAKILPRSGFFVESIIFSNIYGFLATKFNRTTSQARVELGASLGRGTNNGNSGNNIKISNQLDNLPKSSRRSTSTCNVGRDLSYLGLFCSSSLPSPVGHKNGLLSAYFACLSGLGLL